MFNPVLNLKRATESMNAAYGVLNKKGDEVSETLKLYREQTNKVKMTYLNRN